jgi:uncharacterized protein YegJ (DUF2314 family)
MADKIVFEFAIYYLPTPTKDPFSELDKLLQDKFKGFKKVDTISHTQGGMAIRPKLVTDVSESYAPPSLELIQYCGRGLSQEQAVALQESKSVLLLDFAYSREHVWTGMRAAVALTSSLARTTGGLLWDEETREIFSPDEWDRRRITNWTEELPDISNHITVHAYGTGKDVRAITLGMSNFGLPDIVIDGFPWSLSRFGDVIYLFGQSLAEDPTIERDGEFDLNIRAIRNSRMREDQVEHLQSGATAVALLSLKIGRRESGDPKNRLIEITFDRYPGADVHVRQYEMVTSFFGREDKVTRTSAGPSRELLEAIGRARARLFAVRKAFNAGLPPGEFIQIKSPFSAPDGGTECMWVEVTAWEEDKIRGILMSKPREIPELQRGQTVDVSEASVLDYCLLHANGSREGDETGMILRRTVPAANGTRK